MRLSQVYRMLSPLVAGGLYYSGLVPLARWWTRRAGRRLIILNYHRADANLRRHLVYLRKHYRILPLDVALEELYGSARERHGPSDASDARTPLVITFDDGYRDNVTHARALARELRTPISVFLPAGYVESGARFHWLEGEYLAQHARVERATIAGRTYTLASAKERQHLAHALDAHIRFARSVAEREAFLAAARKLLAVPAGIPAEEQPARPLSWEEAQEMAAEGWVTYGAHTMHHPILARLADPGEVEYEVAESRAAVERRLGQPVRAFAYPFGRPRDIGAQALQAVRRAGYRWAVTTVPGFNTARTNPHLLRRMPTDVSEHWLVMAAQAAGVWWGVVDALQRLLGVPLDTGALPHAPLFQYRLWEKVKRVKLLASRRRRPRRAGASDWHGGRVTARQAVETVEVGD